MASAAASAKSARVEVDRAMFVCWNDVGDLLGVYVLQAISRLSDRARIAPSYRAGPRGSLDPNQFRNTGHWLLR